MMNDNDQVMKQEKNHMQRMQQKELVHMNRNNNDMKNKSEADRLKQERFQHEEMINMQKKADELKAQSMKQMIRSQKDEQKELRAHEAALKRQQQRLDLIRRINEENEKRLQIQAEVDRLEKEEADWIKKLQNTSQV